MASADDNREIQSVLNFLACHLDHIHTDLRAKYDAVHEAQKGSLALVG